MLTDNQVNLENQRALGRLEGKVDALILQLTEHIKRDETAWLRLSSLEKKMVWLSGAAAVVMFFATNVLKKMGLI